MVEVCHVRAAGNNPDGFLSGREVERQQSHLAAAAGRGWSVEPVPTDGRTHSWYPNACVTCTHDDPAARTKRLADAVAHEASELLQGGADIPVLRLSMDPTDAAEIGAIADRVRPAVTRLMGQLHDIGGTQSQGVGVATLLATWMRAAALIQWRAEVHTRDADQAIVEMDTAKTDGAMVVGPDGEIVCVCGSDDLLYEYEGARTHRVYGLAGTGAAPLLEVEGRYEIVVGDERRGRVRCEACGKLLAIPSGVTIRYR